MEKFDIKTDKNRNRLYCILKGFFLESEIELAFDIISTELNELSDGYDVILDIGNMTTQPEFLKELFNDRLKRIIEPDCRYIFKVIPDKRLKPEKYLDRIPRVNHRRIRWISYIQEAEAFLETDSLIKGIIYS